MKKQRVRTQNDSSEVHSLIPLDDARRHGCLDDVHAFPCENLLQKLKKLVRKSQHEVEQSVTRTQELEASDLWYKQEAEGAKSARLHSHSHGPMPDTQLSGKKV